MKPLLITAAIFSLVGSGVVAAQSKQLNNVTAPVAADTTAATDTDPARAASSSGALLHRGPNSVSGQPGAPIGALPPSPAVDAGTMMERRMATRPTIHHYRGHHRTSHHMRHHRHHHHTK